MKLIPQNVVEETWQRLYRAVPSLRQSFLPVGLALLQKRNLVEKRNDRYEFNEVFFEKWILERD